MWMRFTERARRVVFFAQEETGKLGENLVMSEHLLLGLVRETDSFAAQVLEEMGSPVGSVRHAMEAALKHRDKKNAKSGMDMNLAPEAKKVVDLAFVESRDLKNNHIGTEHLLLGLLREPKGLGGRILRETGADLDLARAVIRRKQTEYTSRDAPEARADAPPAAPKTALSALKSFSLGRDKTTPEIPISEPEPQADAPPLPQIGDLGTLADTLNRTQTEVCVSLSALLLLRDALHIKDHHAYRELYAGTQFVMTPTGTPLKLLQKANDQYYQVRHIGGDDDGKIGWLFAPCFALSGPDTRPFPPPLDSTETEETPALADILSLIPREIGAELIYFAPGLPPLIRIPSGVQTPNAPLPLLSEHQLRDLVFPLLPGRDMTANADRIVSVDYLAPDNTLFHISVIASPHFVVCFRYNGGTENGVS